jgi:hypothetical protein
LTSKCRPIRGGKPLVVGGGDARAGNILAAAFAEGGPAARRLGEQHEFVEVLVNHRLQRQIGVYEALGIAFDLLADTPTLPGQPGVDPELLRNFQRQPIVKHADRRREYSRSGSERFAD